MIEKNNDEYTLVTQKIMNIHSRICITCVYVYTYTYTYIYIYIYIKYAYTQCLQRVLSRTAFLAQNVCKYIVFFGFCHVYTWGSDMYLTCIYDICITHTWRPHLRCLPCTWALLRKMTCTDGLFCGNDMYRQSIL